MVVVNANLTDEERLNDTNHQYSNDYCVKCGHYPEVSMIREVDCECDCHDWWVLYIMWALYRWDYSRNDGV